jgi:hypothetical protein
MACATMALGLTSSHAATATEIHGMGYSVRFVGNQRETIMIGKRAAILDLCTLKGRPARFGHRLLLSAAGRERARHHRTP